MRRVLLCLFMLAGACLVFDLKFWPDHHEKVAIAKATIAVPIATTTTIMPDPSPNVASQALGTAVPVPVVNDLPLTVIRDAKSYDGSAPVTRSVFHFSIGWAGADKAPFLEHQGENASCGTFPAQFAPGTTVKMVTTDPKLAGKLSSMVGQTEIEICNITKSRIWDPFKDFWLEVTPQP